MSLDTAEYVSGGYVITQEVDATALNHWYRTVFNVQEDLLPPSILSVGMCSARFAPFWEWAGASEQDIVDFGIAYDKHDAVEAWAHARTNEEVGYPHYFYRLPTVYDYIQRFVTDAHKLQILGIGLHVDDVPKLATIEALNPAPTDKSGAQYAGFLDCGFGQALRRAEPPATGEQLGFDVIACRYQIDHAWHCNGLAKDALEKFHFRPNRYGLVDTKTDADHLAAYATEQFIEDSIWLSVLVTRYPVQT